MKTPVNAALLRWAREEHGLSVDEAAHAVHVKPDRLDSWEHGDALPTVNQVRNLAHLYQRTPAFFLLRQAPRSAQSRPTDFRGRGSDQLGRVLAREIARVRARRLHYLRLFEGPPRPLPPIDDVLDDPEKAARQFRDILSVPLTEQLSFTDDSEALQAWLNAVEGMNVLVFQMSHVDPEVCRGFSIYEEVLPAISLNGAEGPSSRIFTLFHEVAHLLSRTSALCDVWQGSAVEWRCNVFAGELLMPAAIFRHQLSDLAGDPLIELARRFNVSQSAVAVRLRTLNLIDQERLDGYLTVAREKALAKRQADKGKQTSGGPPAHLLKLRNLGPRYVSAVLEAMHDEEISVVDAAQYLESMVATLDRMETELARRGGGV